MRQRGRDAERLLRWYPRAWRAGHGAVLLGTWEEVLRDRGRPGLSRGEAWSMRVHGLAERLSPSAAIRLAVASLTCGVLGWVGVLSLADTPGAAGRGALTVLAQALWAGLCPALVSLSALALLRGLGVLGAAGSVTAALCSVPAWALGALSSFSYSVGFDRADAGQPSTAFSAAFPVLLVAAVAVGAAALTPVWNGVLHLISRRRLRRLTSASAAVPTALVLGVSAVNPVLWPLAAVALLIVAQVRSKRHYARPAAVATESSTLAASGTIGASAPALPSRLRRRVIVLGALSAVLGAPGTAQALLGEPLGSSFAGLAGLPAMNAGLALGSLAAVPLVAAAGLLATRRWGRHATVAMVMVIAALVLMCVSRLQGTDGSFGLIFAACLLAALAVIAPFTGRLPGGRRGRWVLTALICVVAAWAVALPLLVALPLAVPLLALALVWWTVRTPRLRAQRDMTNGHVA